MQTDPIVIFSYFLILLIGLLSGLYFGFWIRNFKRLVKEAHCTRHHKKELKTQKKLKEKELKEKALEDKKIPKKTLKEKRCEKKSHRRKRKKQKKELAQPNLLEERVREYNSLASIGCAIEKKDCDSFIRAARTSQDEKYAAGTK